MADATAAPADELGDSEEDAQHWDDGNDAHQSGLHGDARDNVMIDTQTFNEVGAHIPP